MTATLPDLSRPGALKVRGGSMRPSLLDGDVVIGAPATLAELRAGDVVAVYHPEEDIAVCHRVLDVDLAQGSFRMRGDSAPGVDLVRSEAVGDRLFRVRAYLRGDGKPVQLTRARNVWHLWRQRVRNVLRKLKGRIA